jgi:hypothetical protein
VEQVNRSDVNKGNRKMRSLKIAMAVAFAVAGLVSVSSVGQFGVAEAAGHVTKGKPGKCGMGKFFSKADKGCIAK